MFEFSMRLWEKSVEILNGFPDKHPNFVFRSSGQRFDVNMASFCVEF